MKLKDKTLPFWAWRKSDAGKFFINRFIKMEMNRYFYDLSFTVYNPSMSKAHGMMFGKAGRVITSYHKNSMGVFKELQFLPSSFQWVMIKEIFEQENVRL